MIDHNATEIALRFGRKLAEADRYLAYYEVHDEAMRAAYHHGVLDSELGRFLFIGQPQLRILQSVARPHDPGPRMRPHV
jgi:hypothetical protein